MIWGIKRARWDGGRGLAMLAALIWTLLPILCPSVDAGELAHSTPAAGEHHDSGAHHHPAPHDGGQCCKAVSSAQFVVPVGASLASLKAVIVDAGLPTMPPQLLLGAEPQRRVAHDATGPPRRSPAKFVNYAPLAPPAAG